MVEFLRLVVGVPTWFEISPEIIVGLPSGLSMLSMKTYITALADKSEVAELMALIALMECVVPLGTGMLGSYVFSRTSVSFPGCFYIIVAAVNVVPIGLGL